METKLKSISFNLSDFKMKTVEELEDNESQYKQCGVTPYF